MRFIHGKIKVIKKALFNKLLKLNKLKMSILIEYYKYESGVKLLYKLFRTLIYD